MKKPYISPVIETVEYESNTALCGSCAHIDPTVFDFDVQVFLEIAGSDAFSSGDGCDYPLDDVTSSCKFASEGFIFIS